MMEYKLGETVKILRTRRGVSQEDLAAALATFHKIDDVTESANMVRDVLLPKMAALRAPCDEAEQRTAEGCWPFPTYGDLLFGVE